MRIERGGDLRGESSRREHRSTTEDARNRSGATGAIVAAIPLKRLSKAKGRLAAHLPALERRRLTVHMLEGVVSAVRQSGRIERLALVSDEAQLARELGLVHLPDRGDLNSSLQGAVEWACHLGAQSLMILPADLPLVSGADIIALCDACPAGDGVCLAALRDGGTGALLLTPPDAIPPTFGAESARHHQQLAADRGLALSLVSVPGLAIDLDTQENIGVGAWYEKNIACHVPR